MASLRIHNLSLIVVVVAMAGCRSLPPGVTRSDYLVQRSATGQDELLMIKMREVVPDGPTLSLVQPDRLNPEDDIHSVQCRIWAVTGLCVERHQQDFAKTGQPDRIYHASLAEGGLHKLGKPVGIPAFEYAAPSFSPNRKRIVYACREYSNSDWQVWVMNADGTEPAFLHHGTDPAWLGNGVIVFADRRAIWRVDLNGARLKKLVADDFLNCSHPAPNPQGDRIAFVKGRAHQPETRDIWVFGLKKEIQQKITIHPARDDLPRWDKAGKYIRFRSTRGRRWGVWRVPGKFELTDDKKGK